VYPPIFEYAEIRCGTNSSAQRRTRVEYLVQYEHCRAFRGSPGLAIMKISYCHDASRENAVIGFNDFSQQDKPILVLTTRTITVPASLGTVGAAAIADIGVSSDLVCDVIADTVNELIFAQSQVSRPHN
jgi:hypothetical protein